MSQISELALESIKLADGELDEEDSDSLLSLAGILESDLIDISDQHDFYIGQGIAEALTTDRHFEQAGFIRLLSP